MQFFHHASVFLCVLVLSNLLENRGVNALDCPAGQQPGPPCNPTAWIDLSTPTVADPIKRMGYGFAADEDGKLWLFAGKEKSGPFDFAGNMLDTMEVYDVATASWSVVAYAPGPAPSARWLFGFTYLNNKLWVFGGEDTSGNMLSEVWSFDINTLAWTLVSDNTPDPFKPSPRLWSGMAGAGNSIFVFGGQAASFPDGLAGSLSALGGLFEFDTLSSTWLDSSSSIGEPAPRSAVAMTALGSKLYVFGGRNDTDQYFDAGTLVRPVFANNEMYEFDLVGKTWTDLTPGYGGLLPQVAYGAGMVASIDKIYVYGGNQKRNQAVHIYGIWSYELATGEWSVPLPSTPKAEHPVLQVSGSSVFLHGGYSNYPTREGTELWTFDLECTTCVPSPTTAAPPTTVPATTTAPTTTPLPETTPPGDDAGGNSTEVEVWVGLNEALLCCEPSLRLRLRLERVLLDALTAYEGGDHALAILLLRWFIVQARAAQCPLSDCLQAAVAAAIAIARQIAAEAEADGGDDADGGLAGGDEMREEGLVEAALLEYARAAGIGGGTGSGMGSLVSLARRPTSKLCGYEEGARGPLQCAKKPKEIVVVGSSSSSAP